MPAEPPTVNQLKVAILEECWRQLLDEVLNKGYYGKAAVELNIQDGTIQQMRLMTDRIKR